MGDITVALSDDMPITTANFENLVRQGFYNGVTFHRVIDHFMIQSGDPTGTGTGGPGYFIPDEFSASGSNRNDRGTIAMANAGPNTGGSQFFINLVDNNYLDTKHPVFGRVVAGMDVADAIGKVPVNMQDKPKTRVVITSAAMVTAAPVSTLAPWSQPTAPVAKTTPAPASNWGKRYAVGDPGSYLGTRFSTGGTTTAPDSTQRAATGPTLKPGSKSYDITPPAPGTFVRWYPAARWAAGFK